MSIGFLQDIERELERGRQVFACPGTGRNQWHVSKKVEDLLRLARMTADQRKSAVEIVRLIHCADAMTTLFLVPTQVGEEQGRAEPQIQWSTVESKEAAELMRDVRQGPAPFFGIETEQSVEPR